MSKFIKGPDRNQFMLLPNSVEDYISDNNEVRIIDAFVDSLDLSSLGFLKASPSLIGAPSYDPKDLLKIFIYSYPKKIRSSRRIALELIWLVRGITPDFRTLSDFRKDNSSSIKKVLHEFNKLCLDLNVFSRELASLDGSKFKAVNSKDNNFTQNKLIDRIQRLDKKIDEYLSLLDQNDEDSSTLSSDSMDITSKIASAKQKAIEYNQLLKQMLDQGENQISLTDKDSRLMKCNNNMLVGFNAQVVTDTKSHIISNFDISNQPNDLGLMFDMANDTKNELNVDQIEQLVDGGYKDEDDIKKCLENKIIPILPDGVYTVTWDYKDHLIDDNIKKGLTNSDVKKCLEHGVIPDCYSHLNMSIKIEDVPVFVNQNALLPSSDHHFLVYKASQGFFVRDRFHNCVICPCNHSLSFNRKKADSDVFIGDSFCLHCHHKCTSKNVRSVEIPFYEDFRYFFKKKVFHNLFEKSYSSIYS